MRVEASSHVRTVTPRFISGVMGCALHSCADPQSRLRPFWVERVGDWASGEGLDGGGIVA